MAMFGLYVAVLYVVVLANKDSYSIYSNKEIRSMVVYSHHQHTIGLFDVSNTKRCVTLRTKNRLLILL